jgi:hypothetical protein
MASIQISTETVIDVCRRDLPREIRPFAPEIGILMVTVRALVAQHTQKRQWRFVGELGQCAGPKARSGVALEIIVRHWRSTFSGPIKSAGVDVSVFED